MDYNAIMERLDKIEETTEFASAEIFQQRGTMIGRWIGWLSGAVIAIILVTVLGI